ncbi:MAG: DUF1592 domain-containing protein [Akkermansiaceae bacterium]|jgi:hypothetical protein|nr:DUF1592 domain-containing protein [Akkermansiaceae bacterium]MDP4647718.1 DUF1592 domain-containing protein [Akkermansiaceae bacterium]MDP4780262.1 DUF1592 domain-containing protein [Akkermansiaceae bacterium]MDP4846255.1 DUF1592 domain-containing protein [Akkermansiaceae bacterium]MDP4996524.1 DUF1592 domain-containing protein [Akkermansiaceae bacterium]
MHNFLENYCIDCHDGGIKKGGLDLEKISTDNIAKHPEIWEHIILRIDSRQMPPMDEKYRPEETEYASTVKLLEDYLDSIAAENPDPGHAEPLRRMTRTEYGNAIRDLLGVEIDVSELLPKDESSHGFDNITIGSLSPTLLNRYIDAARKISRIAVGGEQGSPRVRIIRLPADRTQEEHIEGLPPGTRGGTVIPHTFPATGEYEVSVRLTRDRNEVVEGLNGTHTMEILVDGETQSSFSIKRPKGTIDYDEIDAHLNTRIKVEAGTRQFGATFIEGSKSLSEDMREPYQARFNVHRHPRLSPAIYQISILGPIEQETTAKATWPWREIEADGSDEERARKILGSLMRIAYRRTVTEEDFTSPIEFFKEGLASGGFEKGIEDALSAVLVSPNFLFRIETDPSDAKPGDVLPIGDFALASRLSYFLWSSLPDTELLDLAEAGKLSDQKNMQAQIRRMLADPRSEALSTNFASQWLHIRNLAAVSPDLRLFPDFDDNLREAFRRETELLFQSIVDEDRSIIDLITADYTFLNQRLAAHYGIPGIYGSRFRKVKLAEGTNRGGLLRQGSILTVTSYANRTSPVLRGNWVLENIIGTPTPPPPADIPSLEDVSVSADLPMRERLGKHRESKSCATCHNLMDPPGFALENFDAVGRWREMEGASPVDSSGGLPDGSLFTGTDGMEKALLDRPDLFARTLTEKLLTYALGRGLEASDMPAVRRILRDAEPSGYQFSEIITGVVSSVPFTMKKCHVPD